MDRVDRDVYRNGSEIAWFRIDELPSLHLRFAWTGAVCAVHGDFYLYLSQNFYRDWLTRGLRRRSPELPAAAALHHSAVHICCTIPASGIASARAICHPIHAAGVDLDGHVVVLAGPSGVGKSTLVTSLAGGSRARLLSDTFSAALWCRRAPVPEPLLLDNWSQRWLGDTRLKLSPISHRYRLSRDGFHWPVERSSSSGVTQLLLFPQRAETHYIRPLTPNKRARAAEREQPHRQRPATLLGVRVDSRARRSDAAGIGARARSWSVSPTRCRPSSSESIPTSPPHPLRARSGRSSRARRSFRDRETHRMPRLGSHRRARRCRPRASRVRLARVIS